MITPMISPMRSSIIKSMINHDGGGAETRYFIDLDGVILFQYYDIDTPEVINGNFSIKYASTTVKEMDFADGLGITLGGLFKAPASATDIELNGVSVGLGAAAPLDGKENLVTFVGLVNETITTYGQSGLGTNYFDGILSDSVTPRDSFKLGNSTAASGSTETSTTSV